SNVLSNLIRPGDLPENEFTEHGLRPGETLTTTFLISDEEGRPITINPITAGLPPTAHWDFPAGQTADIAGTFTWTPDASEAGNLFTATLTADNGVAQNVFTLTLYVPTVAEQQVVIAEYLANPTSNAELPFYNPLLRDPPVAIDMTINDEYLELVNLSEEAVELEGWTMSDGVQMRHQFYYPLTLAAKSAAILYGGPLNGYPPLLDVPFEPASESTYGLALNNNGDTITIRNAIGGVVARVIYPADAVSSGGSMTRYPTINGGFRPQVAVSDLVVTPGRQYDGKLWSEPPTIPPADVGAISAARNPNGSITLTWEAEAGQTYSVETATAVNGPFTGIANGLTTGEYTDTDTGAAAKFYQVRSP
ncbi:MAG: lamin tail domain-containing protein, partial [Verrucomicrobiae bacterium]|nr:lamin tail domain-containing protein [Verrucomicrobiae bacterium]